MRLVVAPQVFEFIRVQAPEPRLLLREGMRKLAKQQGDIKALNGNLDGYFRLRIGGFRLIFRYDADESGRFIHCLLLERRALVYQVFSHTVPDRLRETAAAFFPAAQPRPISYRAVTRRSGSTRRSPRSGSAVRSPG